MPPTLVRVDGFEHQVASTNGGTGAIWGQINTAGSISFDTTTKRTGAASLKVTESGAAICKIGGLIAASQNVIVQSVYILMTAAPSVTSRILSNFITAGEGATQFDVVASTGVLQCKCGDGTAQNGPSITDGAWHRLDYYADLSGATKTVKWTVDGVAQTDATSTTNTATAYATQCPHYGTNISTHTATVWFDDALLSHTAADYPIGVADGFDDYEVLSSLPTGDGTHNAGTDEIEDQAGNDIGAVTAYNLIDEWPPEVTDYIRQTTGGAGNGNYAEVTLGDITAGTIWAVHGYLAYTSAATQANNGTTRVVLADGTTIDNIWSGDHSDGSTTNLFYKQKLLTAPGGGWSETNYNGAKCRVGFSTDSNPDPYWMAVLLQVAVPVSAGDTLFGQAIF